MRRTWGRNGKRGRCADGPEGSDRGEDRHGNHEFSRRWQENPYVHHPTQGRAHDIKPTVSATHVAPLRRLGEWKGEVEISDADGGA